MVTQQGTKVFRPPQATAPKQWPAGNLLNHKLVLLFGSKRYPVMEPIAWPRLLSFFYQSNRWLLRDIRDINGLPLIHKDKRTEGENDREDSCENTKRLSVCVRGCVYNRVKALLCLVGRQLT